MRIETLILTIRSRIFHKLIFALIVYLAFNKSLSADELGFEKTAASHPNVLLIAIDDLNDWIGCLDGHPNASSPHMDQLAERGVLFTNAHCQAPICNPSRTSIMYGMRPSSSGVYMNAPKPWTVDRLKDKPTLSRHFAANGYDTFTAGKIYHGSGLPPEDFQNIGPRGGQKNKLDKRIVPATKEGANGLWDFGPQTFPEEKFNDHVSADWIMKQLEERKPTDKPFFMAVGFYRPHVPFYAPQRVFDQVPKEDIKLPKTKLDDRDDLPKIVSEIAVAPAAPDHAWFVESGRWQEAVQAYLACIRFTDEQVGRLIAALDQSPFADNTIVVLYSDHGFFLGEKQRWAKQSLWERATKVPFIVIAPGRSKGKTCQQPVELLSIYPTLIELCGLTKQPHLEGRSICSLLDDPNSAWPHVALTTHGQNNHSVRTTTHRYIRYRDGSEEVYDLVNDPNEWTNLADRPEVTELKVSLAKHFPRVNVVEAKSKPNTKKNSNRGKKEKK